MRKLKLDLDALSVESFATTPEPRREGGTVFGQNHCTCQTQCTCPGCPTCEATCGNSWTCGDTCADSCGYTCPGNQTCGGGAHTCMWDSCDGACGTYFCV